MLVLSFLFHHKLRIARSDSHRHIVRETRQTLRHDKGVESSNDNIYFVDVFRSMFDHMGLGTWILYGHVYSSLAAALRSKQLGPTQPPHCMFQETILL